MLLLLNRFKSNQITVRLGEFDFNEQTSASRIDHSVAAIYMHERYDPSTYVNDVSILKLEKKVNFTDYVRPICRPHLDIFIDNQSAFVAGNLSKL